jgi:hypothetical protein
MRWVLWRQWLCLSYENDGEGTIGGLGGSFPLVLCNHMRTKGFIFIFYWGLFTFSFGFQGTLTISPNIEHSIGSNKRKPRLF